MSKITLNLLANLNNANSVIANINSNSTTIQTAMDNTLSRDGTAPNQMGHVLDMNSNYIVNLPAATATGEAVEFNQFSTALSSLGTGGAASAALVTAVAAASSSATASTLAATTSIASASAASSSATLSSAYASSSAVSAAAAASSAASITGQGVWNNTNILSKTVNYTVAAGDRGKTLWISNNALLTVTFPAVGSLTADFIIRVINGDTTRAKILSIPVLGNVFLWPNDSCFVYVAAGLFYCDAPTRYNFTTNPILYVDSTLGNDANDGLAPGSGNALATIQQAVQYCHQYLDSGGSPPLIQLADGTYNEQVQIAYSDGPNAIVIQGNAGAPSNVIVNCPGGGTCFNIQEPATVLLNYMLLTTSGNGSTGVFIRQFATCDLNSISFNAFPSGIHITLENRGSCGVTGPYNINGGAVIHLSCGDLSFFSGTTYAATVAAGLTFTTFIESEFGSVIQLGMPFIGAGAGSATTAKQYSCDYNSIINRNGSVIPGNVSGSTSNGGIVI